MTITAGNLIALATGGVLNSSDAVYPAESHVAQGVAYGPTGTEYTGTLGASEAGTESLFETLYKGGARASMFSAFGTAAAYTAAASGESKSITIRWVPRSEVLKTYGEFDLDLDSLAMFDAYDDVAYGIVQPAYGDTITVGGQTYVVRAWTHGPGEWRITAIRKEAIQRGGGVRHAGAI